MSSTLLKSMVAYKCDDISERRTIYTLIVNTAESNVHPISYHHWPIMTGQLYEVMEMICNLASDAYNGNLKWHDGYGKMGICSEFITYGENVLKRAEELSTPVPELFDYNIIYFEKNSPCKDLLENFSSLDGFEIKDFFNSKVLFKKRPTVIDLYWCQAIKDHYEGCVRYAKKPMELDEAKLRNDLYEDGYMLPEIYRNMFRTPTVPQDTLYDFDKSQP